MFAQQENVLKIIFNENPLMLNASVAKIESALMNKKQAHNRWKDSGNENLLRENRDLCNWVKRLVCTVKFEERDEGSITLQRRPHFLFCFLM